MDFPKDQRGRGAAASRKGRINVEHGAARRPTIPKIMAQGTDYFKLTIQNYLDARAREDELFAPRYANPKKNIDDCCTFIINQVRQSGCNGLRRGNILYGTPLLRRGGHRHRQTRQLQGSGQSHRRTDRGGKAEARRNAIRKAESEAYAKLAKAKSKPKKIEDNKLMPSLF